MPDFSKLNKYNRDKISEELKEIDDYEEKIQILIKLKIDFLENTSDGEKSVELFPKVKGSNLIDWEWGSFDKWCDKQIDNYSKILNTLSYKKSIGKSGLSSFEIALKHRYLYLAKKENLTSREVAEIYKGIKTPKNIEMAYNDISKKRKIPNEKQLKNVYDALSEHPEIQKAIQNDIDTLI